MSSSSDPFVSIRNDVHATRTYLIVWTTILVWDWLTTLRAEVRFIWRGKTTLLQVLFLLQRYGTLVFHGIAFVLILSDIPQRICRKTFWLETFGLVYVLVTADALLSIRVWALWNNSRRALVALTALLLADVAVLVAAACFVQALDIARSIAVATDALGCVAVDSPGETRKLSALFFIAPFVTNWVLFIATVYRSAMITRKLEGTKLPVLKRLVSDGALYFACIVAANGLNVYFHVQPNVYLQSFNVPAVVVLSSSLSCRLSLSLLCRPPQTCSTLRTSHLHAPATNLNQSFSLETE